LKNELCLLFEIGVAAEGLRSHLSLSSSLDKLARTARESRDFSLRLEKFSDQGTSF